MLVAHLPAARRDWAHQDVGRGKLTGASAHYRRGAGGRRGKVGRQREQTLLAAARIVADRLADHKTPQEIVLVVAPPARVKVARNMTAIAGELVVDMRTVGDRVEPQQPG